MNLYFSLRSFLFIFPTLVFSISFTYSILSGIAHLDRSPFFISFEILSLILLFISSVFSLAILATMIIGLSPHLESLTPIAATSLTPLHLETMSSICKDEIHSPPDLIISLIRSVIIKDPVSSIYPTSPVCK